MRVSELMRDDLPTFERPMKTISGNSRSGYWSFLTAEAMYRPCVMTTGSEAGAPAARLSVCFSIGWSGFCSVMALAPFMLYLFLWQ